jgi:cation transporter-like permease
MAGYESGVAAMPWASLAVVFYGLLGGFPALLVIGGLGGAAAHAIGGTDPRRVLRFTLAFSAMAALLGVLVMAVLDKLIGPY